MKKHIVIGIGEILWDLLPVGKVLGGAPANFAHHAMQLGAEGVTVSAVGNDDMGNEISRIIESENLINGLYIADKPTGTVGVELSNGIPKYTIYEDVAWDHLELTDVAKVYLEKADAICFGSLAQRNHVSRIAIWKALEMVPASCLKVFDINLRQGYYSKELISKSLEFADVFKINEEEIVLFKELFGMNGTEEELCQLLVEKFDLTLLALTKGAEGSLLVAKDTNSFIATPRVKVADTIGAGDSFTASMVMGLLYKQPLAVLHQKAVDVSAFVCTNSGATPLLPEEIKYCFD
ncbi:carbohydrate kinase family protein [Saccharicrinis fermentans]|uniref:5-dehydro-2-deoxygluconokinase n=1 Tax=Saccharicrinis fermentans DSM 9555 = JCM 21142 TaxID=869213 RepID=W7Y5P0_9BACT|nr:carbohydrate kinase [Saccharicrinis fermentans]GAF02908.1 5-dehydro-2-deoxygluconokinase [Saccharicrinis fermentans DSM 9555 = JCM 21142]